MQQASKRIFLAVVVWSMVIPSHALEGAQSWRQSLPSMRYLKSKVPSREDIASFLFNRYGLLFGTLSLGAIIALKMGFFEHSVPAAQPPQASVGNPKQSPPGPGVLESKGVAAGQPGTAKVNWHPFLKALLRAQFTPNDLTILAEVLRQISSTLGS